ncbi:MAG TPA: 4-hydroxyphenylpyruvate dioxygenase [Candidatus Binatia bacterium]|nr:4-hydroxyphenylpyruvate dioxygenase [Candidatus Binatia bacterium]
MASRPVKATQKTPTGPAAHTRGQQRRPRTTTENPLGTDGFEFVEYAAPASAGLGAVFEKMGFVAVARHRSKNVTLYRQGDINFVVNHEPNSFAQAFARVHGPSLCAFAIRVRDANFALKQLVALGAKSYHGRIGPMELNIPAIRGIGGSLIYLVDRYGDRTIYDVDFIPNDTAPRQIEPAGLTHIDHLTHNVHQGRMDQWREFYKRLFNFREIRYFNIHGQKTGLRSRALVSACGKIRIPINEPADRQSQVQEYLEAYHGEGIQHIAVATADIYATVEALRASGVDFLDTPQGYYERLAKGSLAADEDRERLARNQILIDGEAGAGLLLQIFTKPVIGPIFFEIIQRKGNAGFGEGNFRALFETIEKDQMARGVVR